MADPLVAGVAAGRCTGLAKMQLRYHETVALQR